VRWGINLIWCISFVIQFRCQVTQNQFGLNILISMNYIAVYRLLIYFNFNNWSNSCDHMWQLLLLWEDEKFWLTDWLVFYGTSTQDWSICANGGRERREKRGGNGGLVVTQPHSRCTNSCSQQNTANFNSMSLINYFYYCILLTFYSYLSKKQSKTTNYKLLINLKSAVYRLKCIQKKK